MTELEKIIDEIESAASLEAEETLAAAKDEADGILSAANADAERQAAEAEADTERRVAEIKLAGVSARQRARRERLLEARQDLISEVIGGVRKKLHTLPEPEYFGLLARLAASAAADGDGAVLLNEKDRMRLPPDFEAMLSDMLPGGARLSVSDEIRPIDGGLILKYGSVEQNCSFDAIFAARREEFSDLINDALFADK